MTSPQPSTDPQISALHRHGRVPHVRGLVLAAGAGRRMGGPKALLRVTPAEPTLVERAVDLLTVGGCDGVTVVVGAAGAEVELLVRSLGRDITIAHCPDWDEGMGASLRSGLSSLAATTHEGEGVTEAVLVTLVDLPDITPDVVARLLDSADDTGESSEQRAQGHWRRELRRAAYGGCLATRRSSDATTGMRWRARPAATKVRAATSAATRTRSSSAATWPPDAMPTPPRSWAGCGRRRLTKRARARARSATCAGRRRGQRRFT